LCLAQDLLYVRRVAILLQLLGPRFAHQSISVFSTFALFQQINPVVKAPSLVCDDGEILMGSTLIIECAEVLAAPPARVSWPMQSGSSLSRVSRAAMAARPGLYFAIDSTTSRAQAGTSSR
jgi:glutathione S-transferase